MMIAVPVGVRQISHLFQEQLLGKVSQPLVISRHNQELGMENPPPWLRCPMTTLGNYFQKTKYAYCIAGNF